MIDKQILSSEKDDLACLVNTMLAGLVMQIDRWSTIKVLA